MKVVGKYIVVFLGLMGAYLLFGMAGTLVSDRAVERHVKQTLEFTDLKGDFWFAFVCQPNWFMDNFTDALIVNQAMCQGRRIWNGKEEMPGLWERLMLVPRMNKGGEECEALRVLTEGGEGMKAVYYPRYWHGSTFLMRMLLGMEDYVTLRGWFYLVSSLLLVWVVLEMRRRVGIWAAVVYLFSIVAVDGFMMQFSIQFLPVLLLTLAGTLWVLRHGSIALPGFVIGSLTAYFDLLTAPLMTWGVPMLTAIVAGDGRRNGTRKWKPTEALGYATWFVGYGATWGAKWVLATVSTRMDVFADAMREASVRTGVADYTRWDAAMINLGMINWVAVALVAVVLLVLVVRHYDRSGWQKAAGCLVVSVVPIVWYMALADHSHLHYWFTYRSLAVTVMGVLFGLGSLAGRKSHDVRAKK